jgi:hypothetical protein
MVSNYRGKSWLYFFNVFNTESYIRARLPINVMGLVFRDLRQVMRLVLSRGSLRKRVENIVL